jgi:hypothetical protein
MDTKPCRQCKQPIHPDARLCQHCHGFQSWIAGQRDPRFFGVTFGVIILLLFSLFLIPMHALSGLSKVDTGNALSISDTSFRYAQTPEGIRVATFGMIHNGSHVDHSHVWFRINEYDDSGKVVDTMLIEDPGLLVKAGATTPFRVTGLLSVGQSDVKRSEVLVERSTRRGKDD